MYDATYLFLQVIAIVYFAVTTCLGERVQVGVLFPLVCVTFLSVVCVTAASVHSPDIRQATKLGATVVRADCTQDFETRQACFSGTIVTAAKTQQPYRYIGPHAAKQKVVLQLVCHH